MPEVKPAEAPAAKEQPKENKPNKLAQSVPLPMGLAQLY